MNDEETPAFRILIAEDNPADQRLLGEALKATPLNCHVQLVRDGAEALTAVQLAGTKPGFPCPDVFVLDLHLPRIDGLQVLKAFRANTNCSSTPVLIFTSSESPHEQQRAESFDNVHYEHKPLDLDAFLAIGQKIGRLAGAARV